MVDLGPIAPLLFAATLGVGATAPAQPDAAPITLETETGPAGVTLQVVGLSPTPAEADYALEVSSGAGGNRSVQRGSVRLQPDRRAVLLTTRLGGDAGRGWRATLTVTPRPGERYEIKREAD